MKKLFLIFTMAIFLFSFSSAYAITKHTAPPLGGAAKDVVAVGSSIKVFYNDRNGDGTPDDTTGFWQEVFLPAGEEAKAVMLQVHGGSDTTYDIDTATTGFLYSHEEGGAFVVFGKGVEISLGKLSPSTSHTSLGWIKTTANLKVAIFILY